MKLLSIAYFQIQNVMKDEKDQENQSSFKLNLKEIIHNTSYFSWFIRSTVSEYLTFASNLVAQSNVNKLEVTRSIIRMNELENDIKINLKCHYIRNSNSIYIVITDSEYPSPIIFNYLSKKISNIDSSLSADNLTVDLKELQNLNSKYNGKIEKIQGQLDDIKIIMEQNIKDIIARGETLESLIQKTQDLSDHSKLFVKRIEKHNSCCRRMF